MLALVNLLNGGGDAGAYALQVLERQLQIIDEFESNGDRPKQSYKLVAFGSYLRGILYEDDPLRLGVAKEAFERALELEPHSSLAREGLERVTAGRHSAPGNGVVHVIALLGLGPFRVAANEEVSQSALAIAQVIWAISRDRITLPILSEVKIPALAFHAENPSEAHVSLDGQRVAATEVVTDVDLIAQAEFDAMRDHIVARAVLRRAFKATITEGLKEVVNPDRGNREPDPLIDLAISLAGWLWAESEGVDLRSWSLLPATFQAARIELPAGVHEIAVQAGRMGAPIGPLQSVQVLVRDGRNTYVVALLPGLGTAPAPLTSEPLEPSVP
jgi:hypothetical protein